MKNFLLVFIAGGFGSGLRYLIGKYIAEIPDQKQVQQPDYYL